MKSPTRNAHPEQPDNRDQVIIEISPPREAADDYKSHLDAILKVPSFVLDEQFGRVSIPAESRDLNVGMPQDSVSYIVRGTVAKKMLADLKNTRYVVRVYPDEPIVPFDSPVQSCDCNYARPSGSIDDLVRGLGIDQIWRDGVKGKDIVIGFIDGGITALNRPLQTGEMPEKVVEGVIDGWPTDDWGTKAGWAEHGNVSALAALAIAPEAKAYDIRISDHGLISDALRAYEWIIDRFCRDGTPHVLCNPWGIATQSVAPSYAVHPHHILTRKVVQAIQLGMLVVFAAGNYGSGCALNTPGLEPNPEVQIFGANGHPEVITIAGVNIQGAYVGYSSAGPAALDPKKPNFCAPTHFVNDPYISTGTSASCAVAAGVLALLKQARRSLIQKEATAALEQTASNRWGEGWNCYTGFGIIQAEEAYSMLSGLERIQSGAID